MNNQLHARFLYAVDAGFKDNDVSSKSLYSIDGMISVQFFLKLLMCLQLSEIYYKLLLLPDSLKLDHVICDNVKSVVTASKAELHELQREHQEKTKGISGNADRSLGDDYKVMLTFHLSDTMASDVSFVSLIVYLWSALDG